MAEAAYGSLPFAEMVRFFRRKLNLPTDSWTDIYKHEHDWAFVVAGANRDALVADFRAAVEKAITDGATLEAFRKDFDRIVATHGWDYSGGRDWRSRVIYETNLNTSYAAGRYEQLQAAPYWQYEHADWVTNPRHQHLAWDGLVLARDDPWWKTHYPPNGWGCQCSVRGLWPRDLQRLGKDAPDEAPEVNLVERVIGQRSLNGPRTVQVPEGIDPGFEYTPGAARLRSAIPPERPEPLLAGSTGGHGLPNLLPRQPLPPPRAASAADLLPDGLKPEQYANAFLGVFGATIDRPVIYRDAIAERVVLGAELFKDSKGSWKEDKYGRGRFMTLLARVLSDPDEVWARLEWQYAIGKAVVRRRYLARFEVEGQSVPALAVFELGPDGWSGTTVFVGDVQNENHWRVGALLYRRQ